MKIGISLNLDVTKIDKARLYKGEKGTYLNVTTFVDLDEADQYGNHGMITQDVSKEEREQKVQGAILGNVKVFWKGEGQQSNAPPANASQAAPSADFSDDIPFN